MKAIWFDNEEQTRYIFGTNEELKEVLNFCSTKLSQKPSICGTGELCYQYKIKDEDTDKIHVVCIEKEQGYGMCYNNFVYEVFPIFSGGTHFPLELDEELYALDNPTIDDIFYTIRDCYYEGIAMCSCNYDLSIDAFSLIRED